MELVTVVGAVIGAVALLHPQRIPRLYLDWLATLALTALLFFPLQVRHNYYPTPFRGLWSRPTEPINSPVPPD